MGKSGVNVIRERRWNALATRTGEAALAVDVLTEDWEE
jgi:hypothetical protein